MTPREISAKGWQVYRERLRAALEPTSIGKFVAIDVDTGEHFVANDPGEAAVKLQALRPGATIFAIRIGYPSTYRVGAWRARSN